MTKTIAIQGDKASFHDIAAQKFFGSDIELFCCDTFTETFASVKDGHAEYAVCAIENSLFGSINETYDLLVQNNFTIVGEVYLRVEQCLIGLPGTTLADIQEVYSHPVALAQCEAFLDTQLPDAERLEFYDTAASVEKVKLIGLKSAAAIASRQAAKLHDLEVIDAEIETNKQNYTRFIVLSSKPANDPKSNKTSLIIKTSHETGALYRALGTFAERSLTMTKLQSRPIIGKAWHYIFYVDVEAGLQDVRLKAALDELSDQAAEVTILGSYQAGSKDL